MDAIDLIGRVAYALNDTSYVRWTKAMHYEYLTDAQRAVVMLRPDANAETVSQQLTASSTRQSIPSGGYRLIDVVRNMGSDGASPGSPITVVERDTLDDSNRTWHSETGATSIENYAFDERSPTVFYVTPPPHASTAVYVDMVYSKAPAEVTADGDTIEINEVYVEALREYMLYRAMSLNTASAQSGQRATEHLQRFYLLLGEEQKALIVNSPNKREDRDG